MRILRSFSAPSAPRLLRARKLNHRELLPLVISAFIVMISLSAGQVCAQAADRIARTPDLGPLEKLANHHPAWAVPANDTGIVPADRQLDNLILVLARSPEQEQAFEQLLKDQQDPSSPEFHHWLTPGEIGERFGLSPGDIATVSGWLQSQKLHVTWVAPSGIFIGFGGAAADLGRAFQTEFHSYNVKGRQRISVASDPMVPVALAPVIRAVRGLFTPGERPNHTAQRMLNPAAQRKQLSSPELTVSSNGLLFSFIAPADFAVIYDLPSGLTGAGYTIGLVEQARTDMADFTNFKIPTLTTFANPTEVIPTAFGGVDPGPAYTTPPDCLVNDYDCGSDVYDYLDDQGEATLDVQRAGSTAPGAALLLVTASEASGGIAVDAQYLVNTSPIPAQVMSVSFGECELDAGLSAVEFWDSLFQQAAGEGISVFVASGDSGASGCDEAFAPPPANPEANSPNSICSSSYATCVGGTRFNDLAPPCPPTAVICQTSSSQYWSATNGPGLLSALSYIPEGAWNDSLWVSSSNPEAAASGGGVSIYIPTPSWQTGTGVPSPGTGRYTPDVSFSAAVWDPYFGCWAAYGASCLESEDIPFVAFSGTSAAAPAMAGVAALLDQSKGSAQGNLNPGIYLTAARTPAAFHDVTVASSGVSACSLNTASMCNNSIPWTYPSADGDSGDQEGYLVQTGYDEVTGWGSLDIAKFIDDYSKQPITPSVTVTPSSSSITTTQSLQVSVAVSAGLGLTPSGSVILTSGTYTQSSALSGGAASILIPAGSLAVGTDTLSVAYTPPSTITPSIFTSATGSNTVTVTAATGTNPLVAWNTPAPITYGTPLSVAQLDATASVPGTFSYSPAAGTVLTAGSQILIVSFTPNDTADYPPATSMVMLTVNKATPSITWPTPAPIPFGTQLSSAQLDATANVPGSFAYSLAVGAGLSAGSYPLTVTFTPADTTDYTTATASVTLTVSKATTTVSSWPTASAITYGQPLGFSTLSGGSMGSGTIYGTAIDVPGTFAWTAPGTVPPGTGSFPESVTFTPNDSTDFTSVSGTVSVEVDKVTPTIRWATPAAITYGTALSATQLDASSQVAGTFVYNPAAGTVLGAGQQTLQVTFTPTNTSDYNVVTDSTVLTVNMVTPTVTAWPAASAISYGQTLANSSLTGGSASVSGTFAWNDPATRIGAGSSLQSVTFTPNDFTDYSSVSGSVSVQVNMATPVINWPAPTAIYYGTALSATQLDASSPVAGTFVYSPAAGTVPAAGNDTLSVTLTPADTADYTTATASVNLIVINPTPSFGLSASPGSLSVPQSSTGTFTITVSDVGGFSGAVTLAATGLPSGVTASFAAGTAAGTQVMALSASSTAALGGPVPVTVTGTSGGLSASVTVSLSVTAGPTFGPSGASGSDGPISVDPGAMTGNTSTISAVGINGFSGAVNLSCSITPAAASDPATCSLSPASVTLSGSTAEASTLTVNTTASTTAYNQIKRLFWPSAGGTALALLLMIGVPRRRRNWLAMVGLAVVFASISAVGCGVTNGGNFGSSGGGGNPGTSAGTYTVTVTGTGTSIGSSSSVTATVGTVTLTVN